MGMGVRRDIMGWGRCEGRTTHRQAVVGEELGHAVTALRFMGFHLHPLEEPWELWGRRHRLGSDVKRALLQSCQLAQAIWDLWRGEMWGGGHCGVTLSGPPTQRHALGMGSVSKEGGGGRSPNWDPSSLGIDGIPPFSRGEKTSPNPTPTPPNTTKPNPIPTKPIQSQ